MLFNLSDRKLYLFSQNKKIEIIILFSHNLFFHFGLSVTPSDGVTRGGPPPPPHLSTPLEPPNLAVQIYEVWPACILNRNEKQILTIYKDSATQDGISRTNRT